MGHPNIAAIYGLEEAGETHALVLELVEGEDLATTLRARSFHVEEALEIAVQIAEALEFAHESGVVHRDLKPANVKVRKWQVSTNGGAWPRWSRAGDEIFIRSGAGATAHMMSVSVQTTPEMQLGTPVTLFRATDAPQLSYESGGAR